MTFLITGILLLLPALALGQAVPYSAVVMEVTGKASASRQGVSRPLEAGGVLYPGEVVETAPDASLTLYYPESGEEEQWPGGLTFTVGSQQSEPRDPRMQSRNRKVSLPSLETPPGGLKLRGRGQAPKPADPPR